MEDSHRLRRPISNRRARFLEKKMSWDSLSRNRALLLDIGRRTSDVGRRCESSNRRCIQVPFKMESADCELVQTCGVCEQICDQEEILIHSCLEGYHSYTVDPSSLYFYPVADDGTILRRSRVNNIEQIVQEPSTMIMNDNNRNIVQISQKRTKQKGSKQTLKRQKINDSTESKLNFDDEELLILEVQKRPPLWDYSLPLVERRCTIKQRLWSEIVVALNGKISIEEAQRKFKSLHDTYRKIMQLEQRPSESARKDTGQKWPHYYSMSFLKDSCLQKVTVSNMNSDDSNLSLINEDNTESIQTDSNEGRKRKKSDVSTNALERMVDIICKEDKIVLPAPPEPNEIDSFLTLVGFRLQKMSSKTRFQIMQKILQLTYDTIIEENFNE